MNYLQAMGEAHNEIEKRSKLLENNMTRLSGVSTVLAEVVADLNANAIETDRRVSKIEDELAKNIEENNSRIQEATLDKIESDRLQEAVVAVVKRICNGGNSPAYKDKSISSKCFGLVWNYVFDAIGLESRNGERRKKSYIRHKHFERALACLKEYTPPAFLVREINERNSMWND